MKDYGIFDMFGEAHQNALGEVARILKLTTGLELNYKNDWKSLQNTAACFNLRFDQNGFLVHIEK